MTIFRIILIIIEAIGAIWAYIQIKEAESSDKVVFYVFATLICVVTIVVNITLLRKL